MDNELSLNWYADGYSTAHIRNSNEAFRDIERKIRDQDLLIKQLEAQVKYLMERSI